MRLSLRKSRIVGRMLIIRVEDQQILFRLILQDGALGVDIVLEVFVFIQMVRRQICNDGNVRPTDHAVKLERAEHRNVFRLNLGYFAK